MAVDVTISFGLYEASIDSVGASLRRLTFEGRDLVVPFEPGSVRPAYRGATLAPWPNRVVDGVYEFRGERFQLDISEPARNHALHGLVAWSEFSEVSRGASALELRTSLAPGPGYPHSLDISVSYRLDAAGLHETVSARNEGNAPAPYGVGPHPYLLAGSGRVDDWTFSLPADTVLSVDDRLAPVAAVPVDDPAHGDFDFRRPRRLGSTFIDHAYTDLTFAGGRATAVLSTPDGRGVAMTWDEKCPWVQVHTADQPDPHLNRLGLAVEPMTCPPDAFNSGVDLIVLEPGDTTSATWTIAAI